MKVNKPVKSISIDQFNKLVGGSLNIKLSKKTKNIGNLYNQMADPNARIVSCKFEPTVFDNKVDDVRKLTKEELSMIVIKNDKIEITSHNDSFIISHKAPNGKHFTVKDLISAVEETERQNRGKTQWFGGIDVHHIFFEGLRQINRNGGNLKGWKYNIFWGS